MVSSLILAAAQFIAVVTALPADLIVRVPGQQVIGAPADPLNPGGSPVDGTFRQYVRDGSTSAGWPNRLDNWASFEDLFNADRPSIGVGCQQWGVAPNSETETTQLHDAILQVSGEALVDPRFILAIVMQESQGCVRVPTSLNVNPAIFNPGLMQSHSGSFTCNNNQGTILDPCPQEQIVGMIRDGTSGTDAGDGLAACINQGAQGSNDAGSTQAFFRAARIYNTGSITDPNDLNAAAAGDPAYVNNVANRVKGWNN